MTAKVRATGAERKTRQNLKCRTMHIPCTTSAAQKNKPIAGMRPWAHRKQESLAVTSYRAQLPGQKVIRRPRTADRHFAVLQLLSGGAITVLILFHALGVDEVGDINQHALRSDLLAAHFFFQSEEHTSELQSHSFI